MIYPLYCSEREGEEGLDEGVSETPKSVEDSVAPLRHIPYADQLKKKQRKIVQVLKKVKKEVAKFETKQCHRTYDQLPAWLQQDYMWTPKPESTSTKTSAKTAEFTDKGNNDDTQTSATDPDTQSKEPSTKKLKSAEGTAVDATSQETSTADTKEKTATEQSMVSAQVEPLREWNVGPIPGCCCPVDKIRKAPLLTGYRNKCEFTIGKNETGEVCVGFRRGRFRDRNVTVARPTEQCMTCSSAMIAFCLAMEKFLADSPLSVYSVVERTGVWRQVTVRSATGKGVNQLLAVIQVST